MTHDVAIQLESVSRDFRSGENIVHALQAVSLTLSSGRMAMITGPSGCGKTTLLSIISGMLRPSSGAVHVLGSRIDQLDERNKTSFRQKNIGFVFQQFHLVPTLTAAENIAVPLLIAGKNYQEALDMARDQMDLFGLGERTEAMPTALSGGQQQRVAIARAMITSPRILVCDEPTAALDAENRLVVLGLLKELCADSRRTVIVVTHDSRIFSFADERIEMSDGRVDGEPIA